jgi:two-component system response regulator
MLWTRLSISQLSSHCQSPLAPSHEPRPQCVIHLRVGELWDINPWTVIGRTREAIVWSDVNTLVPELVLVESDPVDERLLTAGILASDVPCQVTVWQDGEEALAYLLDDRLPLPAVVLLDHSLPIVSGPAVLARLRDHNKTRLVPVVVLGGGVSEQVLRECRRLGANSCVAKSAAMLQQEERLACIARYWLRTNLALDSSRRFRRDTPFQESSRGMRSD